MNQEEFRGQQTHSTNPLPAQPEEHSAPQPGPVPPVANLNKKRRGKGWLWLLGVVAVIALFATARYFVNRDREPVVWDVPSTQATGETANSGAESDVFYVAGTENTVPIYDEDGKQTGTLIRGTQVTLDVEDDITLDGKKYYPLRENDEQYMSEENLAEDMQSAVTGFSMLVKTTQSLRADPESLQLLGLAEKGEQVKVLGCDRLNADGSVHMYRVQTQTQVGYLPPYYLTMDEDEANLPYDQTGTGANHLGRGNLYGGGKAGTLDFYPRQKLESESNHMPERCYTLYLNSDMDTMELIDKYIALAKSTKINAFVVDIMDGGSVSYPSDVLAAYSPGANANAINTQEEFGTVIQKLKDNGFYVIGRITAFNDYFFAKDHPEYAIADATGEPLELSGMYWPSAYSRYAWEYKVALAKEAVELFGFNEIQFDYVRFPDGTYDYDSTDNIDYHNEYNETKAQAVQRFLMYACDVLHESGVYVSADVFGETSNPYVAAYGQYFPAISNVVDVISGMPYPDHYEPYGDYVPWLQPYDAIDTWAKGVVARQSEIPTPAIVRTWIQAYDAIRPPYNEYGPAEVKAEIDALLDNGLDGGFITWNAGSSYSKYQSLKPAFDQLK